MNSRLQEIDAKCILFHNPLTLTVLVTTNDAQWEGMGEVGSARHEPALLPPCPTIKVLSYSYCQRSIPSISKFSTLRVKFLWVLFTHLK